MCNLRAHQICWDFYVVADQHSQLMWKTYNKGKIYGRNSVSNMPQYKQIPWLFDT